MLLQKAHVLDETHLLFHFQSPLSLVTPQLLEFSSRLNLIEPALFHIRHFLFDLLCLSATILSDLVQPVSLVNPQLHLHLSYFTLMFLMVALTLLSYLVQVFLGVLEFAFDLAQKVGCSVEVLSFNRPSSLMKLLERLFRSLPRHLTDPPLPAGRVLRAPINLRLYSLKLAPQRGILHVVSLD